MVLGQDCGRARSPSTAGSWAFPAYFPGCLVERWLQLVAALVQKSGGAGQGTTAAVRLVFLDILVTEQAQRRRASSWVWMCKALGHDNVREDGWVGGWMNGLTEKEEGKGIKGQGERWMDG